MVNIAKIVGYISFLLLVGCNSKYSTLEPAGPASLAVAWIWWIMMIVTVAILIGMCGLWWFAICKQDKDYTKQQTQKILTTFMLWGGIGLPTVACALLVIFGAPSGYKLLPTPAYDTLQINVHAQQWFWNVTYPKYDIAQIDTLHIPVGVPVNIYVTSEDVIHSFWVPRLGGKIDAIPGRRNAIQLQAYTAGTYGGQCAEYCGSAHAFMKFEVVALDAAEFERWIVQSGGKLD